MHKTLRILITIDVLLSAGIGLTAPIFAIFVTQQINGGTIVEVGLATAIFLVVRSVLQLPLAAYSDKRGRRKKFMAAGTALSGLVLFGYVFATEITHVYLLEAISGVAVALATPPWMALFSSNLTKGKEGYEWSVYQTLFGLGSAATAAIGGTLVALIGFRLAFGLIGVLMIVGAAAYYTAKIPEQSALHYYDELRRQMAARDRK